MLNKEKEIENIKICLIGDSIFDVQVDMHSMGKSPKENMISKLFEEDIFCEEFWQLQTIYPIL